MSTSQKNKLYQRAWYNRQKENGSIVYLLTLTDGNTYVGATTNSLKKRLWQHKTDKSGCLKQLGCNIDHIKAEILEQVGLEDSLKDREQFWIDKLKPTINTVRAGYNQCHYRKDRKQAPLTTVIIFRGISYLTKYSLWKALGQTRYGTFKSRLHRFPEQLAYALGLEKAKKI